MYGYPRCVLVRHLNTSSSFLARAASSNSVPLSQPKKAITETDKLPTTDYNHKLNDFNGKFREEQQIRAVELFKEHDESASDQVVEISEADKFINSLINRGDFYGVRPRNDVTSHSVSIEISFGKIKKMLNDNQRISAEHLVRAILIPLQEKNPAIVEMIQSAEASYIPFFIRCCGLVLSDVAEDQKLLILEYLLKALKNNGFKFHIETYNAILDVWLENGCEFEVDEIVKKVEVDHKLQPDVEFFNKLLWKLAETGQIKQLKKMLLKMKCQGILPDLNSELAQIFAFSRVGDTDHVETLVKKALDKYGEDKAPDCLAARIRGTLANGNIDKFRILLRSAVVQAQSIRMNDANTPAPSNRHVLNISHDALFDIVWRLAKHSQMGDGQQYAALTQQILETAQRKAGFFKRLLRETERHIAHGFYYSATALISDTTRVKSMLEGQRKHTYIKHLLPRLANHMIRNRVDSEVIKDVANRMIVNFGPEATFYHDLAFSILNFKDYDYDERFATFAQFVDAIDPDRSRTHLILPLLVRCPTLQAKQKVLYQCSQIGYTDVASISPYMMARLFYHPMLETMALKTKLNDKEKLDVVSKVLESFGIKSELTWNSLFDFAKSVNEGTHKFYLPINFKNFISWLKDENEKISKKKRAAAAEKESKYTYRLFKKILSNGDLERMHLFLIQRGGFPPETKFDEELDPLLNMYLDHANIGYLRKLLQILSSVTPESEPHCDDENKPGYNPMTVSPVKNYHLLRILRRFFMDSTNVSSTIEFFYELKRLFPQSVSFVETRYEASRAYEQLFATIFASENIKVTNVNECIDLLNLLIKQDIITLPTTENLTTFIIEKVKHRFGWDAAVDTWLKFQSNLYCSNGIFALMKFAVENNDNTQIQFLLHRAKNFISSSRVNSFLAAAYLVNGRDEKAHEIFEKEQGVINSFDCSVTFQLLLHQRVRKGVSEFAELCLEYTDLKNDPKCCRLFINHWIYFSAGRRPLTDALNLYVLFRKYGVYLDRNQMEKLNGIVTPQQNIFDKWIFNTKTAILNTPKKTMDNKFLQKVKLFEEDLKVIRNGGALEPKVCDNLIDETEDPIPIENMIII